MAFHYKKDYNKLSDEQLLEMILSGSHDEAAAYLLYNRYDPLLRNLYWELIHDDFWFYDCVNELYMHLKGKDGSWHNLRGFQWRSTFGCWLKEVANNKFKDALKKLVKDDCRTISIDNDNPEKPKIQISIDEQEDIERRQQKVLLLEAIGKLKDDDQRFVILKRFQGYNSKEIATLLQRKWLKHGIIKYNQKKELVIPNEDYVNVRTQRAKIELKKMIVEL